ncbi:MAG TPA: AMP-binding protein [Verrucomicrobiales bacterium]|nr:AMP-binding protein [Verrucomicrobiales bacterium]
MGNTRETMREAQLEKLNRLLRVLNGSENRFQAARLSRAWNVLPIRSMEAFRSMVPCTTREELTQDFQENPPFGTNLTFPLERYTRYCQTSGSTGEPMAWLDTPESWESMLGCWRKVYSAAGLGEGRERIFFAFSFGPFLGFWTAYEAALQLGHLCIPGGGMSSLARAGAMRRAGAAVLCCTPTYAMRLGRMVQEEGGEAPPVEKVIVAGEPGGSIPATRACISALWNGARVFDHHGMTEVGPVSYEESSVPGSLQVIEESYLAEILDPGSESETPEGETGELVLTTLDRAACPLIRYRTGDMVRGRFTPGLSLEGGVLGRVDDMVLVRGVNVYPSAIEGILRRFPEVVEYRVLEIRRDSMTELEIEVEGQAGSPRDLTERIGARLRDQLQLRIPVRWATPGSLPLQEFKARRWERQTMAAEEPAPRASGEQES